MDKILVKKTILYYFKSALNEKTRSFIVFFSRLVTIVASLFGPIYSSRIIDKISNFAGNRQDIFMDLIYLLFVLVGLELISFVAWRIHEYSIVKYQLNVMKNLFLKCFKYIQGHSYRFFSNSFSGALVKKINKFVYSFESITDTIIYHIMGTFVTIIFVIIVIFSKNYILGIILLTWLIVFSYFQYYFYKKKLPFDIIAQENDSKVTGYLADTITNTINIKTFSSAKREYNLFGSVIGKWYKSNKIARYKNNKINILNGGTMAIVYLASFYFMIKFWVAGTLSTGTIVLVNLYLFRIFEQMFSIGNVFKRLYNSISEGYEMVKILQKPHEIIDKTNNKLKVDKGEIIFDNVLFYYNKNNPIFEKLNLKIKPNEKIALVGHSGAGKTTIIKLLFRFFEINGGKILMDGKDISQYTQDSLRDQMSLVSQEPMLFHRTIKENIMYGKPKANMSEVIEASKKAKCHEFIMGLQNGYDTFVGERGVKLSGGERQRVAIARAILENKKIIILDEATSSLDSESEQYIQTAIGNLMKGKTAIIIAHRLSTIMKMDRIIVMDKGKIIEEGKHKTLINKPNGIYKKLWDIQSGDFVI